MKLIPILFVINMCLILSTGLFAYDSTDEFFAQDLRAHFQNENSLNQVKDLLLVIDIQQRFIASRKNSLQDNVLLAIQKAMAENKMIVFIEYASMGPTLQLLLSPVEAYPLHIRLFKQFDTAYNPVKAMLEVFEIKDINEIQVCGINTDGCVLSTVKDLCIHKVAHRITLLEPCCNSDESSLHERAIKELQVFANSNPVLDIRFSMD